MLGVLIGSVAVLFFAIPLVIAALAILGAVLSGAGVLFAAGIFGGHGIILGIILGYIAYRSFRKARMADCGELKTEP